MTPKVKLFIVTFTSSDVVSGNVATLVQNTVNNWLTANSITAGNAVSISNDVIKSEGTASYQQFVLLLYNS